MPDAIIDEYFNNTNAKLEDYMLECNITKKMLEDSIEQLKAWFKMQPHLPNVELTDTYYTKALCFSKFSIEKAKNKLENLFTAKTLTPEFFSDNDPLGDEFKLICSKYCEWAVLPKLTKNKERVVLSKFKITNDASLFSPAKAFKYIYTGFELRLSYETCFKDVYVLDCEQMRFGYVVKFTPSFMKTNLFISKNCYGARIQGIHVINMPSYSAPVFNILKSILTGKLVNRLYIHNNLEDLYKYVDRDILPEEYGGNSGSYKMLNEKLQTMMELDECREKILASQNYKSDESKRHPDTKGKFDEMLGITGSFRKLDID